MELETCGPHRMAKEEGRGTAISRLISACMAFTSLQYSPVMMAHYGYAQQAEHPSEAPIPFLPFLIPLFPTPTPAPSTHPHTWINGALLMMVHYGVVVQTGRAPP